MRKNSPRKWLHAILDLLPVIILPIFALAVRSDNNFQPIEIQVGEQVQKINYKYQSNEVNNLDDLQINKIYHLNNFNINNVQSSTYIMNINFIKINEFDIDGDIHINDNSTYDYINNNYNYVGFAIYETTIDFIFTNQNSYIDVYYDNCTYLQLSDVIFYITDNTWLTTFKQFCIDNNYLPEYTDYNIIDSVTTEGELVTYNDTDVGSQMVYTLYNATDKYFNFNNVFNFGQIYEWFVLNIFDGNPSLIFPVVWNIVLYEFIMDLVFLIYALFMFFVDFCTNLIDRFHVKCSGGK